MNRPLFLRIWSLCFGAMDAVTGVMLVMAPAFTLRLMRVPAVADECLVFLSWMGVFIASVGFSYALVLRGAREGETVWIFTAIVRSLVAVFLAAKISAGSFPAAWGPVAINDGVVAAVQFALIRAGWWKEGRT